jgi:alginate O-acetyltransferase complex protein AlgI
LLFHTHEFFTLLALTLIAFRLLDSLRGPALLLASLVFYSYAGFQMAIFFFAAVFFNYACYQRIRPGRGLGWLWAAMLVDLGNLFTFKYTGFFLSILGGLGADVGNAQNWSAANLILPVGISFYTFQLMALLIDAYGGSKVRARSLLEFFLFITFFGQLIAGPIMRGDEFLPQLKSPGIPKTRDVASGIGYFLVGLIKKVVLADALLAPRVEGLFADAVRWDAPTSWFLGILFGFQIYYDFSGYCDMAIGLGKLFGFELRVNFSTPYVSRSPSEFWSRWNITLSRWFGDYVYVPLGGSRVPIRRTIANLMITMLVSGLWHGAGFTFLIWGGLHGVYLSAYHGLRRIIPRLERAARSSYASPLTLGMWMTTYFVSVVGWVYFRAGSVVEANGIVKNMLGLGSGLVRGPLAEYALLSTLFLAAHFLEAAFWSRYEAWVETALRIWGRIPGPVQALVAAPVLLTLIALTKDVQGAFIYFQF